MKPDKAKQLRAVLYARYSTDKQRENSIEDQLRECQELADREGFKVVTKFHDKEISGGTVERPGYQAMLTAARRHDFEVLISEDIDRLWRNRAEYGPRSAELEDLGIHWLSCVGDDTRQGDGWGPIIAFKAALAEADRKKSSYRTRRAQKGKAARGEYTGGKAYGYRPDVDKAGTKILAIVPEQAEVIRHIYQWRAKGWSCQRIARQLNADKVPAPGDTWNRKDKGPKRKNAAKGWRPSAIAGDPTRGVGILNNELYRGVMVWGRSKWTRSAQDSSIRKVAQLEAPQWISSDHPELRIIDDKLWQRVKEIQTAPNPRRDAVRKGLAARASGHGSKYWLGTLLVCAECGANYIGDGRRDYVCPSHTSNRCANDMRFRRDDAHAAAPLGKKSPGVLGKMSPVG